MNSEMDFTEKLDRMKQRQAKKRRKLYVSSFFIASILTGGTFYKVDPITKLHVHNGVATYDTTISKKEANDIYQLLDEDMDYQEMSAITLDYLEKERGTLPKTYCKEETFFEIDKMPKEVAYFQPILTEEGYQIIKKVPQFEKTFKEVLAWTSSIEKTKYMEIKNQAMYSLPTEMAPTSLDSFCTWHYQNREDEGPYYETPKQFEIRFFTQFGITFLAAPYALYFTLRKRFKIPSQKEVDRVYNKMLKKHREK